MRRALFYAVTLWSVLWLQVLMDRSLGGTYFPLQLSLITVLYFGLSKGALAGELYGFGLGFLLDASTASFLGLHSMLYAVIGFSAGLFKRQLDESKAWTQSIFTAVVSAGYVLAFNGIERIFSDDHSSFGRLLLLLPLSNMIVAPIVFWLLDYWFELWGALDDRSNGY